MPEPKIVTPAYVPFKTFISVLDSFSSFLPDKIDSTMWPSYSGGIKSQLMGALKFLGLVDDDSQPTEALKTLAKVDQQQRPAQFRAVMKTAYGSLMSLDLTKATPGSFDAEMRKYGQEGETHRKASSFFLQAAKWSGVPLSPLLIKKGSLASSRRRRPSTPTVKPILPIKGGKVSFPRETLMEIGSQREIVLSDGSQLTLKTEKDLFRMCTEDRNFVMGLLDTIEKYESEHPPEEDEDEGEGSE